MGASDGVLARMVMVQTLTVGLASLFGMIVLHKGMPPFLCPIICD